MSGESQVMLMIAGVHLVGVACVVLLILPALRDGPDPPGPPPDNGSDDGRGNDRRHPPGPSKRPTGGIPLPDAVPARVRMREPARLADLLPRRERRPAREPVRTPTRRPIRGRARTHR
jgi:hypothetical protein